MHMRQMGTLHEVASRKALLVTNQAMFSSNIHISRKGKSITNARLIYVNYKKEEEGGPSRFGS